ncbi:MAG: NUDIX domain-containing protein [Myxococcales bacterium]|nr:MAG: NUDIX domain-containing protein [Myxococcales bacterium]
MKRLHLQNHYADGTLSEPYTYDSVVRENLDAVAIVLHSKNRQGQPTLCLRSSLRPPLLTRKNARLCYPQDSDAHTSLWEIPAGLIEADERGLDGLRHCAARECLEEVGLRLAAEDFELLGNSSYLSPGVIAEKVFWLHAFVEGCPIGNPEGDGSPVEQHAQICWVTFAEAKKALAQGVLCDVKSEIALHRIEAWLSR